MARYTTRRRRSYGRRTATTRYGARRTSGLRSGYSFGGRSRRGFGRASREIRLVIQTPSDMLPVRPKVGQFARRVRRARF